MRAAALTNATPDARSLQNRTASDGTSPDDGFGTALADVAQNGTDVGTASTPAGAAALPTVAASALPDTGQGLAALLAKLANGATPAAADIESTAAGGKSDAGSMTASSETATKADKTGDDTQSGAVVAASSAVPDPIAAMAALLPGLAVAPPPATSASPAKASSAVSKALSSSNDVSVANAGAVADPGTAAIAEEGTTTFGFTLVGSATHLAPVPSPAPQAVPQASEAATKDAAPSSTPLAADAATPAVDAETDTSTHDATPASAVASHAETSTSLPAGTLQSLANSVTSFAAGIASASSDAAASAPASSAGQVAADPTPTSVTPARSLTLQLTPGDLGSVTVRLHMTSNGLDVDLAVDDRKTLASISHARDDLASAIGDNGYRVESLTIRGSDASSTSTAGSHDSARSQGESGAGQSFSGGGSGNSGGDASSPRQRAPQSSAAPRDAGRDRGADGVFV